MSKEISNSNQVQRGLTNRHIQMIAIGGSIGTGLFYGSATSIQMAGPAISLSYVIASIIIFLIMRMLGEMCVEEPVSGSFSYFAKKYCGEFSGFMAGWNYYILYLLCAMSELTAVGIYINYWLPDMPQWLSAFICLAVITTANLINVRMYGEMESAMSVIKISAIIAMIILGIYLLFSNGTPCPQNLSNLWAHGGFLPNGWHGLLTSLVIVVFSFGGIELIGMTAAEVQCPEKVLPRAINEVIVRILLFYVGTMLVLTALFPWNQIGLDGSPFVTIFRDIGITSASHIFNFVILVAAISVYNSAIYSNSRMLYSLAKNGQAPKIFTNLSVHGVPILGIFFSSGITLIAVALNYIIPKDVFMYILLVTVVAIIMTWFSIIITHLGFRKAKIKAGLVETLKFKSLFYPISNYICLAFLALIVIEMCLMDSMRPAAYLIPIWMILLYIGFKCMKAKQNRDK